MPPHSADGPPLNSADAIGTESPWSAPASLTPDPDLLQSIPFLTLEPKHDCVFLGPSGVGKSSFLSALPRACQGEVRGDLSISLVSGTSLAELAGDAARYLGGATPSFAATEKPATHDFQVTIRSRDSDTARSVEVIVQDLPGGPLFGSRGHGLAPKLPPLARQWLHGARTASCLVLCVHSMNPDRLLWENALPQLINDLEASSGRLLPRLGRIGRRDLPPLLSPQRQLPFERVLVLLTQIDRVCAAAAEAVLFEGLPSRGPILPILNRLARYPRDLAGRLDPVRFAEDRLGALLGQVRSACSPAAQVAVGLTSAWGFDLPEPEMKDAGEASRLERWSPFGLWEAMLFLATGEARHPVEMLPPQGSTINDSHTLSPSILGERFLQIGEHR